MPKTRTLPTKDELEKAMEVAKGTWQGAKYFSDGVRKIAAAIGFSAQSEGKRLLDAAYSFEKSIYYQLNPGVASWDGQQNQGDYANMHTGIVSDEALPVLQKEEKEEAGFCVHWAISKDSHFLRAYSPLEPSIQAEEVGPSSPTRR